MKLEDGVVCLKLSQKMDELGIKGESNFYWVKINDVTDGNKEKWIVTLDIWSSQEIPHEHYKAYSVAELGEMLPRRLDEYADLICEKRKDEMTVYYGGNDGCGEILRCLTEAETEADARAKMLILLKIDKYTSDSKNKWWCKGDNYLDIKLYEEDGGLTNDKKELLKIVMQYVEDGGGDCKIDEVAIEQNIQNLIDDVEVLAIRIESGEFYEEPNDEFC